MNTFTTHNDALDAKVAAKNRVHRLAMATVPAMIAALQPFIGRKVLKADGTLCKAVRDALPRDNCAGKGASADQWFYHAGSYYLHVQFEVNECNQGRLCRDGSRYGESWQRANVTVCLAAIEDGVLTSTSNTETWRTDYTREEVEKNRFAFEAAQSAKEAAEYALAGFGTHDNG